MRDLPSGVPPVLADALRGLPPGVSERFIEHLAEGTSCDWLSDWLGRAGHPVSATTLKRARQSIGAAQ